MNIREWLGAGQCGPRIVIGASHLTNTRDAHDYLDAIHAGGARVFDTARFYMGGQSEQCLGAWMESRRLQSSVVIVTKGGHPDGNHARVSRQALQQDIDESRHALRMDTLPVFALHRDDETRDARDIADILLDFQEKGMIDAIGVSNWDHARIDAVNRYLLAGGREQLLFSSAQFGLAPWSRPRWAGCKSISGVGNASRAWHRDTQFPLFAWSTLCDGFFTPHFARDSVYVSAANLEIRRRTSVLAARHAVSPVAVALSFVMREGSWVFPVLRCSPQHLEQNALSPSLKLSLEEIAWLELAQADACCAEG